MPRLIIGITGASGALYGVCFLRSLVRFVEGSSSLIVSPSALRVYREEMNSSVSSTEEYLDEILHPNDNRMESKHIFHIEDYHNIGASCASGSSNFDEGMVIIPCSMKTLASISSGITSNLIERSADVCLKERRKLILVPREAPYNMIHLENMLRITRSGGIIFPASPGFYQKPKHLEDLALFVVGRIFSLLGMKHRLFTPWSDILEKNTQKNELKQEDDSDR